jgi:hypothetical protein
MGIPWFRILKLTVGAADVARRVARRNQPETQAVSRPVTSALRGRLFEARVFGVVVSALREAFDRDHQRLELEREQMEAQRDRADRALRLELARQATDREVGRLNLLASTAVAGWIGTLFFTAVFPPGTTPARLALGLGWLLLTLALAATFIGRTHVVQALDRLVRSETLASPARAGSAASVAADWSADLSPASGWAGQSAPWLIVAGLAAVALSTLMR